MFNATVLSTLKEAGYSVETYGGHPICIYRTSSREVSASFQILGDEVVVTFPNLPVGLNEEGFLVSECAGSLSLRFSPTGKFETYREALDDFLNTLVEEVDKLFSEALIIFEKHTVYRNQVIKVEHDIKSRISEYPNVRLFNVTPQTANITFHLSIEEIHRLLDAYRFGM